ncbi:ornithine cyclodeaminase family protein [Pseudoduganella sp. RAF19]|uniref:ornithine cyclodeaminase family protein n=1 Tax=Pseudoduganella sp. RAF19 TaxID=3233052 RepID=UPI003F98C6F4
MPSDARLLLIDRDQAAALLTPDAVMDAVRESFMLHAARAGRVFPMIREALPSGGVWGIKAGDVPEQALLGFKTAGFWPANRSLGAEAHQATIMIVDPATGRPQCLIDGNAITTARTAAAGALGLLALARRDSTRLVVFGTGIQAAAHVDYALRALPSLRTVRYVASDGRVEPAFEARFAGRCDIAAAGRDAVAQADIVITATPGRGPVFDARDLQAGCHVNCVGADTQGKRELPDGVLARAHVWTDDLPQARRIGELQWAPQQKAGELGTLIDCGGRERAADDITIFDMTGLALQDLTVARMMMQRAQAEGIGSSIAWPW